MDEFKLENMVPEIMEKHGGRALASVRAKRESVEVEIERILSEDDHLVERIAIEVEEMARLSSIYKLMFRIGSPVEIGMNPSDIPYRAADVVALPASFNEGVVRWHDPGDEDLQALIARMREIYESVSPHKDAYRTRVIEVSALRSRVKRLLEIEGKIKRVMDPYA